MTISAKPSKAVDSERATSTVASMCCANGDEERHNGEKGWKRRVARFRGYMHAAQLVPYQQNKTGERRATDLG